MSRIHRRNPRHGRPRRERKRTARPVDVGAWVWLEFPPAYTREELASREEKMRWLVDHLTLKTEVKR